jgi:hypothetical protein
VKAHALFMAKKIQRNVKEAVNVNTGELLPQPRGFRLQFTDENKADDKAKHTAYYVRLGYVLQKCEGEAHSNAHIDNCALCMGQVWGWTAVKADAT